MINYGVVCNSQHSSDIQRMRLVVRPRKILLHSGKAITNRSDASGSGSDVLEHLASFQETYYGIHPRPFYCLGMSTAVQSNEIGSVAYSNVLKL